LLELLLSASVERREIASVSESSTKTVEINQRAAILQRH